MRSLKFAAMITLAFAGCSTLSVPAASSNARAVSSFRVLEWNVSDSAWLKHPADTRAVLRHANPDILLLAQVPRAMTADDVRKVLSGIRGAADTVWSIALHDESGVEHTVVASRGALSEVPELEDVSYPDGAELQRASPPDTSTASLKRDAVKAVHVTGAIVRVADRPVMAVAVHLTCCGDADMWREYRRQLAARVIRDRMRATLKRASPAAVILGGDLNLVAGAAPLDTLLTALERSSLGPMKRAEAVRPDGVTDWTWDGRGSQFSSGRLDNVAYSAGSLVVTRAAVWDTEVMSADTLEAHGLTAGTSKSINKHRPVVVDFALTR